MQRLVFDRCDIETCLASKYLGRETRRDTLGAGVDFVILHENFVAECR